MLRIENACYTGSDQRKALFDLDIPENFNGKLLVFVHGYKGFKDWGPWNLVHFECTEAGFGFAKFNLSHNGGTSIYAKDFPDLIAFSKNTYTKEVNDIIHFMNHLSTLNLPEHSLHLIGHSRGGGMSLIAGSEDNRIASITTWAAISSIEKRMPSGDALLDWKTKGVRFELNSRTQQQMPIGYALYEDFQNNKNRLNIQKACEKVQIPCLVVHGTLDGSVPIDDGRNLAEWLKTPLFEIPRANHTFGGVHPIESYKLPDDLQTVLNLTLNFVGNL